MLSVHGYVIEVVEAANCDHDLTHTIRASRVQQEKSKVYKKKPPINASY